MISGKAGRTAYLKAVVLSLGQVMGLPLRGRFLLAATGGASTPGYSWGTPAGFEAYFRGVRALCFFDTRSAFSLRRAC